MFVHDVDGKIGKASLNALEAEHGRLQRRSRSKTGDTIFTSAATAPGGRSLPVD